MLISDSCRYTSGGSYTITDKSNKFHNRCADSFEALIGALYLHLANNHPELNPISEIRYWLMSNTYYPYMLAKAFSPYSNLKTIPLFVKNDMAEVKTYIANHMEKLKRYRNEILLKIYENNEYTISELSLIVYPETTIKEIYKKLGWEYKDPVEVDGLYYQYGNDNIIYGIGETFFGLLDSTYAELNIRGYIVFLEDKEFIFSNKEPSHQLKDKIEKLELEEI